MAKKNNYPKLILKPGKEAAVRRFHPWLFSGAVASKEGAPEDGDVIEIWSADRQYLATGHFGKESICAKIFSFKQEEINYDFWKSKILKAYDFRQRLALTDNKLTNAYRLVFSEGDELPGLIIDYYNGVAVIQAQSAGMFSIRDQVSDALKEIYGSRLKAVYYKSPGSGSDTAGKSPDLFLYGTSENIEILETGHRFLVDFIHGQKTGFFLDQRANRMFAQFYAKDKKVLNAFSYSGAFSVYALKGGATMVHSADTSAQALELANENIKLNALPPDRHKVIRTDVKTYLAGPGEFYDMIILDPPAFAKTHKVSHNALQAYIHINAAALKRLSPEGLLFTFSCSQAISQEVFQSAVLTASLEAGRKVQILHYLAQGPDHPISIFHPEGRYLKGFILFVS